MSTMREEFEADYFGYMPAQKARQRSGDGYLYGQAQFAWEIWKSAYAAGQRAAQPATTADGVRVRPGDKVWVKGTVGVHETTVDEPVTTYDLFGPIPVSRSYSTKDALLAAIRAREKEQG